MSPEGEREATPPPADPFDTGRSVLQSNAVLTWVMTQPEVSCSFTEWGKRVRAQEDRFTMQLGAIALMHGLDSGEALSDANPATLSPLIAADRAHVLREFRAMTLAEGRRLGRACLALTKQVLPRAPLPPCAAAPVAHRLLDRFIDQLDEEEPAP